MPLAAILLSFVDSMIYSTYCPRHPIVDTHSVRSRPPIVYTELKGPSSSSSSEDHHPYTALPSDNYDEKVASRDYSDIAMEERRKCIDAARAVRNAASEAGADVMPQAFVSTGPQMVSPQLVAAAPKTVLPASEAAPSQPATASSDGSHITAYVQAKQDLEYPEEGICRSLRWPSSVPSQASDPLAPEAVPQAVVSTALSPSDRLHVAASASHGAAPRLLPNTNQSAFTFSLPFTLQKAHRLRGRSGSRCYHKALREQLKTVSASDGMRPLRIEVSDELPWREYIASHASYDSLIGTGVEDFFLQFRKKSDPNRGGKSRLDFVIKRCDGSHVLLHPGTKRNNDAQPIVLVPGDFEALI